MKHPSHLLKELQGRARKRFGQHFLASEGVLRRIVAAAELGPAPRVLEIGPGLGGLTELLLEEGAEVLAVELDRDLAAFLRDRLGHHEKLTVVEADAAKLDFGTLLDGSGWACVANLPYNVGTTITTHLLAHPERLDKLVLMLQKEVAERMVAPAGDRSRGSLSVYVEARAHGQVVLSVPPGAFHPPPKVHSSVIRLDLLPQPRSGPVRPAHLERVVRSAFSSPRKSIRNPLSADWPRERVDQALVEAGLDPTARPAVLDLDQWITLAACLPDGAGNEDLD